ncbi:MAG: 5'-nucleotidase [Burkholderiales bacterium]|nr:5'-nucleotidase [Burkholderiales bacterium]
MKRNGSDVADRPHRFGDIRRREEELRAAELEKSRNEKFERQKAIAGWISAIAVPLVLGISGYFVTLALKGHDARAKYIEIAVSILSAAPKSSEEDKTIRRWAIDILDRHSDVPLSKEAKLVLESARQLSGTGLASEVGVTTVALDSRKGPGFPDELSFGNFVTDALRSAYSDPFGRLPPADIALLDSASFRGNRLYPAGTRLTRMDFLKELPFGNAAVLIGISGSELELALQETFGRPGVASVPQVSGAVIKYIVGPEGRKTFKIFHLDGSPIRPDKRYLVATSDFFAEGRVSRFREAPRVPHSTSGRHIYDILLLHVYEQKTIAPVLENRIRKIEQPSAD